jgi:hypothetical protein
VFEPSRPVEWDLLRTEGPEPSLQVLLLVACGLRPPRSKRFGGAGVERDGERRLHNRQGAPTFTRFPRLEDEVRARKYVILRTSRAVTMQFDPLLRWYGDEVRPFLLEHFPDRIDDLDVDAELLRTLTRFSREPVEACFLGAAGKGKSTLINALVAGGDVVVPFGGVQPLTAQGTVLRYAEHPTFTALYLSAVEVERRLLFPLEKALERRAKAEAREASAAPKESPPPEADSAATENKAAAEEDKDDGRFADLERAARALVVANPTKEVPLSYVVDGFRHALGKPARWGSVLAEEDLARLASVASAIARGAHKRDPGSATDEGVRELRADIESHATGHLASIVTDLEVGWPAEILRDGLRLVDLPGVGVSGDVYEGRTREWIRQRARVVVLVVEPRGMDAASAQILHDTGFLNRLLHSSDAPDADPATLVLVLTRMDEPAEADFEKDRAVRKREHLVRRIEETRGTARAQFRDQMLGLMRSTDADLDAAQTQVIERLVSTLRVHPLSAREYRRLRRDDDDDRGFIRDEVESGVPALVDTLRAVLEERAAGIRGRQLTVAQNLADAAQTLMSALEARSEEREAAAQEVERLREAAASFLDPLRTQVVARRAGYNTFLQLTRTRTIPDTVEIALGVVSRDLSVAATRLTDRHWASLRAAVRRGGAYDRREINVSGELSTRAEAPIAEAWVKRILTSVREETSRQIDIEAKMLDEVVKWARDAAPSHVARLSAERDAVQAESRALASVGEALLGDLRKAVRDQLALQVERAVLDACSRFVARGDDTGAGVAARVRGFMSAELVSAVVVALKKPTITFLTTQYAALEQAIRGRFERRQDPMGLALDILAPSEATRAIREDRPRRTTALAGVARVRASAPR